jgi:hypothetical protein
MKRAEALDHAWDQIIRGQDYPVEQLSPADIATIRTIHANANRPEPSSAFARRLREDLMDAASLTLIPDDGLLPSPNGHRGESQLTLLASPHALPWERRWHLSQFTTAALVILVIVAALLAPGPRLWGTEPTAGDESLLMVPAVGTPTIGGTPIADSIAVETLLDTVVADLPAGSGTTSLLRWTLQPSAEALVVPPAKGPRFFVVESGEVIASEAGIEQQLSAGDVYLPADPEQEVAIRVSGPEAATVLRGVVANTLTQSSFDADVHHYEFLLDAYTDVLPGGSGRLVLEQATLSPGSALPPLEISPFVWMTLGNGTLGMTLEGADVPFPWTAGKERTVQSADGLPVEISPGTRMTLRNAGDGPLVLLRLTLTPIATGNVAATPTP